MLVVEVLRSNCMPRMLKYGRRTLLLSLHCLLLFSQREVALAQGTIVFGPPSGTEIGPLPPPPAACPIYFPFAQNDNFANATVLSGYSANICAANASRWNGNNWQATAEPGEPAHGGWPAVNSVWYRWVAPTHGSVELKGSALIAVYTGDTLTTLTYVTNSWLGPFRGSIRQEGVRFEAIAGQTYQIAVDQALTVWGGLPPGQFQLTLQLASIDFVPSNPVTNVVAGQVMNIEFAPYDDAETVSELSLYVAGNKMATLTNGPWQFSYVGTNSGNAAVWAEGLNSSGEPIISWPKTFSFRPANDDFAWATPLPEWTSAGEFMADMRLATWEPSDPLTTLRPVWWRWVAPYSATTVVTLKSIASEIRVFRGENFASFELAASVRSYWPSVPSPGMPVYPTASFQAEAGAVYYFLGDKDAFPGNSYMLSWELSQQTLSLSRSANQRGLVGIPVEVQAMTIETDRPPVSVEILLGKTPPIDPPQIEVLGSLNSTNILYGQVWAASWTPQETGVYYIWARSTNSHGLVHESPKTRFRINAANDDFVGASVIPPRTVRTNVAFNLAWGSAESGEPKHGERSPTRSLWWKWTPSYSGLIRLKAVLNDIGLAVDVFTRTGSKLTRIANNDATPYLEGWSGVIRVRVKAGETYFIRVDDPNLMAVRGPSSGILTLEPGLVPLEGTVNFSFFPVTRAGWGAWERSPQAFMPDCRTPVTGVNFKAQLYVGLNSVSLKPIGAPERFRLAQSGLEGRIYPTPVVVPGIGPARMVLAQIRVWDYNYGATYEAAQRNGGVTGISNVMKGMTGSEESGPGPLLGLHSFCLQPLRH